MFLKKNDCFSDVPSCQHTCFKSGDQRREPGTCKEDFVNQVFSNKKKNEFPNQLHMNLLQTNAKPRQPKEIQSFFCDGPVRFFVSIFAIHLFSKFLGLSESRAEMERRLIPKKPSDGDRSSARISTVDIR